MIEPNELNEIAAHVKSRLTDLKDAQKQGKKVVGYMPEGYLPEELVLASGAIPIGMIRGGDQAAVESSGPYVSRWVDAFYRGQIGYLTDENDPFYSILDLLVVPITDTHCRSIADVVSVYTKINLFQFGVPRKKSLNGLEHYKLGLNRLKDKLEELTGNKITDEKLKKATDLCNRERELFKEISLMRKADELPISFKDYLSLHHSSMIADKEFMVAKLEKIVSNLKKQPHEKPEGPRILLTASTLAYGDAKVATLLEESGATVVIEEVGLGMRPYWNNVSTDGNLMDNIADTYFMKRVFPAWGRPGRERLDFICRLAKDFRVDGVAWYHLLLQEGYKLESFYFPKILKEATGLNMLLLESDYGTFETAPLRTRIESYVHSIRR
ncbi:MAG: 2-hydroxyacyl-CoA dehydratase subunit D [Candidatus Scatomorpha sp.]